MDALSWTPTQQRFLDVLADRQPHPRAELRAQLADEMGGLANIRPHLTHIREKLRPQGEYVVCELYRGTICYRLVCVRRDCRCAGTG